MATLSLLKERTRLGRAAIRVYKKPRGNYAELLYGQSRVALGRLDDASPTTILDQAIRVALGQIKVDDLDALRALQRANKSARWKDHQW